MANDTMKLKWGDGVVVFKRFGRVRSYQGRPIAHRNVWHLDMNESAVIELRRIAGKWWEAAYCDEETFAYRTAQEALDNIRIKIQALADITQHVLDYRKGD